MKPIILILLLSSLEAAYAQRQLEQHIPLQRAQELNLQVNDADVIRIDTWERPEVLITGTVSINDDENNDAYEIAAKSEAGRLIIAAGIPGIDSLPQRITVHNKGQDYVFRNASTKDSVVQQFIKDKGGYEWVSKGVQKDIHLQIKVPAQVKLTVENKYGTVEIAHVPESVHVVSQFGDIDISVPAEAALSLMAHTHFGQVYTDVDWIFEKEKDGLTLIKGSPMEGTLNGGGTSLQLEAKFGNVYLRKSK